MFARKRQRKHRKDQNLIKENTQPTFFHTTATKRKREEDADLSASDLQIPASKRSRINPLVEDIVLPQAIQDAITCPISNQRFKEPVMSPAFNKTIEKTELIKLHTDSGETCEEGIDFVPNRSLKQVIEAIESKNFNLLSEIFICPIQQVTMADPIILITQHGGQSLENDEKIKAFIKKSGRNPLNNITFYEIFIRKNVNLKKVIDAYPDLALLLDKRKPRLTQ